MAESLPRHVAIIMDGNGRWAAERGLPHIEGHRRGSEAVKRVIRAAGELGIQYLTLYAFSTENWHRPKAEVDFLMSLLSEHLDREIDEIRKNNIRLNVIGRLGDLTADLRSRIERYVDETKNNTGLFLTIALSYSGRAEIVDAVKSIAREAKTTGLDPEAIDEAFVSSHLETRGMPDPDLLIRTSGEMRVSNFLLWQISYTELYVTDKLWPDFEKRDLVEALEAFKGRERRFGRRTSVN
ncbi:MAG: isoprenyl transferase [Candidatus Omnitrophica bacterium]|nr:isoprenyl transferase [Candidatus Omnitrophota bacterium]